MVNGPSPLRLIAVIDGTNLKGALADRALTTHLNYRQLAIEIAKRIPASALPARWALQKGRPCVLLPARAQG